MPDLPLTPEQESALGKAAEDARRESHELCGHLIGAAVIDAADLEAVAEWRAAVAALEAALTAAGVAAA